MITGPKIGLYVVNINRTALTTYANGIVDQNISIQFWTYNSNGGDKGAANIQNTGSYNNGFNSKIKYNNNGPSAVTGANTYTIMTLSNCDNKRKP